MTVALCRTLIMALPKCFNPFKHKSRQTVKKENLNEKRKEKPPTAAAEATVSTLAAAAVQHLCTYMCICILAGGAAV